MALQGVQFLVPEDKVLFGGIAVVAFAKANILNVVKPQIVLNRVFESIQ